MCIVYSADLLASWKIRPSNRRHAPTEANSSLVNVRSFLKAITSLKNVYTFFRYNKLQYDLYYRYPLNGKFLALWNCRLLLKVFQSDQRLLSFDFKFCKSPPNRWFSNGILSTYITYVFTLRFYRRIASRRKYNFCSSILETQLPLILTKLHLVSLVSRVLKLPFQWYQHVICFQIFRLHAEYSNIYLSKTLWTAYTSKEKR